MSKILEVLRRTDLGTMLVMDEKTEIAKNALREGATISFIQKITGLEESTVQRLKEELNN